MRTINNSFKTKHKFIFILVSTYELTFLTFLNAERNVSNGRTIVPGICKFIGNDSEIAPKLKRARRMHIPCNSLHRNLGKNFSMMTVHM